MRKTYYLWTIGCQMNDADSRRLGDGLQALGLRPVQRADDAGVVVLNTCVVRQQPEEKAYHKLDSLRGFKRKHPKTILALMGCLVGIRDLAPLKERYPFVDLFLPPSDFQPLLERVAEADESQELGPASGAQPSPAITALLPAVLGCSHACAFCVIPSRRGPERSRPAEIILAEVRALAARGVREVTLLGQIIDRYGMDLPEGPRLPELLRTVAAVDGIARVRFLTSHPNWVTGELLDAMAATPQICPHLEIAVQSGDDEVLVRMRRQHTVAQFDELLGTLQRRLPGLAVCTDIIVGFPGETEAQFLNTVALVERWQFDMIRIAKYSERAGTYAARHYPDDVSPGEKERRRLHLEAALREILTRKHAPLAGQIVEVLAEEKRAGRWYGRTPQNQVVYMESDSRDLAGRLVAARVEWAGPFSLIARPEDAS